MTTKRPRTRNASTASAAALRSARGGLGLETWIRGHIADTTSVGSVAVGRRLVWPSDLEPEAVGTRRELRTRRLGERLGHGSGAHARDEYYVIETWKALMARCCRLSSTCTSSGSNNPPAFHSAISARPGSRIPAPTRLVMLSPSSARAFSASDSRRLTMSACWAETSVFSLMLLTRS